MENFKGFYVEKKPKDKPDTLPMLVAVHESEVIPLLVTGHVVYALFEVAGELYKIRMDKAAITILK